MTLRWALVVMLLGVTATCAMRAAASDGVPPVSSGIRTVVHEARDLVFLRTKLRYSTLIVLPDGDDVVEVTCGDKAFWIVNAHGSLVSVKPAKAASETNLHVVTTSGHLYAFVLTEISDHKGEHPDLTVYVEPDEAGDDAPSAPIRVPKYVRADQPEDFLAQAATVREDARRATDLARAQLERELDAFRASYPLRLAFPYRFKADAAPFFVHAIFHDDRATYLQSRASELPALYELKDGRPNLVTFDVHDGTYIVPKVLDRGYLRIGKQTLAFERIDLK